MDILRIVIIVFIIVVTICTLIKKYSKNGKTKTDALMVILNLTKYFVIFLMYMMISSLLIMFFPKPEYNIIIRFVISPIIVLCIILKNNQKEIRKFKLKMLNKINERKYKD